MVKEHNEKNPRDKASILSKLTFWWLYPLFLKGCKRPLEKEDLYKALEQDESQKLGNLVGRNWDREVALSREKGRKPKYLRALIRSFGVSYFLFGLFAFMEECIFKILGPVALGLLIRYFDGASGYTDTWGYILAAAIVVLNIAVFVAHHPFFYGVQCAGMKIRIASCALIYRKAMRLSTKALRQTTVGQLVNLLSNDVNRFDNSVIFIHYLWIGPTQTIISTIILWYEIGPSCLAGIALIILFIPLQSYMGKVFSKLRLATALRTDERVRIMNEIVNAVRVIKMYAWEMPFRNVVEEARRREIKVIMKANYFRAINLTLFFTSAKVILFLALLVYVVTGNILTAEKVFVTSSLINNIRLAMTLFFPFGVSMGSETLISCRRIQTFLEMEEREECNKVIVSKQRPMSRKCRVDGTSIYARWDPRSGEDTLRDISFNVKAGEVMALIGPVGSGKSSLIHSILSELPIKEGTINVHGRIAYASQEPWLFSGSVRDNILFGQSFDPKRYNEVVKVCALERDMELFPDGDKTAVGERGVSLSGGQKARINLARAIYFDADIYLLDDPLSAVDAHVGKHLFEQCISEFLKNKVVILATHQLQFIKTTSHILVLKNGHTLAQGTYSQLKVQGVDFAGIASCEDDTHPTPTPQKKESDHLVTKATKLRRASEAWSILHGSVEDIQEASFDTSSLVATSALAGSVMSVYQEDFFSESINDEEEERRKSVGAETKSIGSVNARVYLKYFLSGGGLLTFISLMTLNILAQLFFSGSDYWLSYWSNTEQIYGQSQLHNNSSLDLMSNTTMNSTMSTFVFTKADRLQYVYIYTGITVLLLIIALSRTVLFFHMCMTSSRNLHNRMFAAVMHVPMQFFETHPIGQILNRFTKDTGQVDDLLPPAMYDFITIFFNFLGIVVMILYLNIWLLLPTVLLSFVFIFVRWVYVSCARDIKRLEGITRSPVFSQLSTTFQGLPTIRAFEGQSACSIQFDKNQDNHTSAWYLFVATSRLFGIYLDFLSCVYLAVVTVSFMFNTDSLGGNVGLGISLAMMLSGMLQWGVRQSAEVESHMTSVERMLEYSKLPPEESPPDDSNSDRKNWPSKGKLTFDQVYLNYTETDPPVLKNLNFTIQPAEKVGIVGRTGAGKSSLLACLFRLTPPQGNIIIDGVLTDNVPLEELRKSLSIIPQDPTLFKGTIRYNLDPFSLYSDDQIWNALDEVQLRDAVAEMNGKLDAQISEGGSNLSVGQRQLVCLSRAILKHNKILVMDEATANVDPETDNWIQKTIREKFTDCTVLTIAHRLHTIMDSDKVMVMDSGMLMEFDTPYHLLQNIHSIFSDLVDQTGPATSQALRKIAEQVHLGIPVGGALKKLRQDSNPSHAEPRRGSLTVTFEDDLEEWTKL